MHVLIKGREELQTKLKPSEMVRFFFEEFLTGQRLMPRGVEPLLNILSKSWLAGGRLHKRLAMKKQVRLSEPPKSITISVGNATVGGSGKTPMVQFLAEEALALKQKPLILTRGYGGDESVMLQHNVRKAVVGVGEQRAETGKELLLKNPSLDVIILDDGLQHYELARDVDIVMVNAMRGCEDRFGKIIPSGALREPWQDALGRAQVIVLHHADQLSEKRLVKLEKKLVEFATQGRQAIRDQGQKPLPPPKLFRSWVEVQGVCRGPKHVYGKPGPLITDPELLFDLEKTMAAFCGIAYSASFGVALSKWLRVTNFPVYFFPDHYEFSEMELEQLLNRAELLVTTEKDYWRMPHSMNDVFGENLFILKTKLVISDHDRFLRAIGLPLRTR